MNERYVSPNDKRTVYQRCVKGQSLTDETLVNEVVLYNDEVFEREFFESEDNVELLKNDRQYEQIEDKMQKYVLF